MGARPEGHGHPAAASRRARGSRTPRATPTDVGVEGAYFRSNGGAGKGDWFYLDWVEAVTHTVEHPAETHLVHHPAVTHQEFRYERQVMTQTHTEYRWSVYERTYTPGDDLPWRSRSIRSTGPRSTGHAGRAGHAVAADRAAASA